MGEIEEMCAPLQEAAKQPDAAGTAAFRETWSKMADKLCGLAEEDEAAGRLLSAGEKYNRAATYYLTCERLQAHGAPGREALYKQFVSTFARGISLSKENCVRIPRHPATQSALIWPGIPRPSGHLFHGHPAGQSERSDAGGALLV
jgi:uncharacterized ParB-like nuclease family protein